MADAHATTTTAAAATATTTTSTAAHVTAPELEQTLTLLTSHRSVLGYMLLSRGQPVTIIRHSGVVFEGEQGKKYASAIARIVQSVQTGLEDVSGGHNDGDDIRFMRIRTKRHEIMISPDERYLLAVLHDPAT
ncbi:hypothetical protein C8Q80DRAFT_1106127 [Daedaleopsis nitida]|nr:hypothetical protein C8Q80DRAFT_1106127 [Daedaleopsis nitida]